MNNKSKEILVIISILILQTLLYIFWGTQKAYIHMDEAYSLGLASYDKTEIQANEDFYNTWHNKEYFEDYLSVQEDEIGQYSQVYENQKNDVHPPLYYLILRFAMGFNINHFSKWPGIIINIIIYMFITILMYCILQKLLNNTSRAKEKSIILAFVSSITMASLTNVLYIRMYSLATLNVLLTLFLHIKLLENKNIRPSLLILIGISALMGVLTHYYYLFVLVTLYIIFFINYIKQKRYKELIWYTVTMAIAGITSLIIFPYSIQHMFFGYRGQGVINNLTDISKFITNISLYILKLNYFAFNNLLVLFIILLIIYTYKKKKENKTEVEKSKFTKILVLPVLIYFIIVSVCSPWIELRYIMPVCGIIFVLVIYYLYMLLNIFYKEKTCNIIIISLLVLVLFMPFVFKIEPEVAFSDKKEIVNKLGNELNVPTIFFFNSSNNRFLDDILLFATVDNSYVAKDIDVNQSNIKNIFEGKDISKGIIVFINEGHDNDNILNITKESLNFENIEHLKRLNACDVYYIN